MPPFCQASRPKRWRRVRRHEGTCPCSADSRHTRALNSSSPSRSIRQPSRIDPSIRTIAPHARSTTPAPNLGPTGVGAAATLRPSLPHHWSLGAVFLMTSKAWTLNKCAGLVVEAAEVPDGGAADGRRHPCPWRRATHTAPPSEWVDGPARARPPEPNFSRSTCS